LQLLEITHAINPPRFLFRFSQSWQQERRQNDNNRDNHQQLYQSESRWTSRMSPWKIPGGILLVAHDFALHNLTTLRGKSSKIRRFVVWRILIQSLVIALRLTHIGA
jgi:hypothetical protein